MYIGAIVTIAGDGRTEGVKASLPVRGSAFKQSSASQLILGSPVAFSELLGQSLLDRVVQRLRGFGIEQVSVISEGAKSKLAPIDDLSSASNTFWSAWDSVVSQFLNNGIDTLLLVRMGPYVEVDIPELVHFHREGAHSVTQVYDDKGPLDLVLVDAAELKAGEGSFRSRLSALLPHRGRYRFSGYSNRLQEPADFRQLVNDAFLTRCAVQPLGREVRPGIWMGDYSFVDDSARVDAPAYIGTGTRIGPSCAIGGSSAIEQGCEVDCGTTIEDCCIFPGTYVGMGLNVRHSIVSGSQLFNLKRNVELEFSDSRLIANTLASRNQVTNATSRFLRPVRTWSSSGISSRVSRVASLVSNHWPGSSG